MRKSRIVMTALLIIGVVALAYYSGYDLRLVPNKPHLRSQPARPAPQELQPEFSLEGGSERDTRGFPQRAIEDLSSEFPGLFLREGSRTEKKVALTFDDGPDSVYTPQILDILKQHNVKGTFFLIGNRAKLLPDVVKRMVQEGNIIGNHTMTHPDIMKLNEEETKQNILQGEAQLASLTGYKTALFRSPYGSLDSPKVKLIANLNYRIIAWNVDSLDWKSLSAEQVKYNILENVKEGSIILQHSAGGTGENLSGTVGALGDIITTLQKEGYKFVTVPELLNIPYQKTAAAPAPAPAP